MTNDHEEPPTTIKEVGIHIGYMRNDIYELKELVKSMPSSFATKIELAEVKTDVGEQIRDLGFRITKVDRRRWAQNTLSAVLGVLLTALVILAFNKLTIQ